MAKEYIDQHLDCTAPKAWLKYSTGRKVTKALFDSTRRMLKKFACKKFLFDRKKVTKNSHHLTFLKFVHVRLPGMTGQET